ncbi:acyl carrier protein [Geothrix sp. 21YS21S-2]|uniref:acyl carrier protein n=1 Tax=Geothrix sp. 21YS21S-2 TaxID=3068893 RepID=UPI0027B95C80|nr:acyl carrier protein [Geothrix sp. 21YS21S-2]
MKLVLDILNEIRPEFDFSTSQSFIADGMLDSFDLLTLVGALEESFGIRIDGQDIVPENFANLATIGHLIEKSQKK